MGPTLPQACHRRLTRFTYVGNLRAVRANFNPGALASLSVIGRYNTPHVERQAAVLDHHHFYRPLCALSRGLCDSFLRVRASTSHGRFRGRTLSDVRLARTPFHDVPRAGWSSDRGWRIVASTLGFQ
jgi:hypothetical protein